MTPLCEECGLACYVCPQCNAEFICSCDEPEHNCSCKEISGVDGNPLGLYCKILNLENIFDGNASLSIDDKGKPLLIGWHINKEGENKDENSFEYVEGYWQGIFPDTTEYDDDYSSLLEPDYLDVNINGYPEEPDY